MKVKKHNEPTTNFTPGHIYEGSNGEIYIACVYEPEKGITSKKPTKTKLLVNLKTGDVPTAEGGGLPYQTYINVTDRYEVKPT